MLYAIPFAFKLELSDECQYHCRMQNNDTNALQRLFNLIRHLRGPEGCPWDREQSFEDILADTIEEAYELEWAGAHHGESEVLDEMGDLLFLVCFAIAVKQETHPDFTIGNIATHAHDKIYNRHPHVFGDAKAATADESLVHWEKIKAEERNHKDAKAGTLDGIAGNLPPLRRAEKVQERAASVGFDWDNPQDIVKKLREEVDELEEAIEGGNRDEIQHEIGDLFFSVVNVSRFLKLDADGALNRSTSKFIDRFQKMETMIHADNKKLSEMTLVEMDEYWDRVKASG
jgi:MazG family protein